MYGTHDIRSNRIGVCSFCNTKIGKLYFTICGNNNILRFHIPVNNSPVMGCLQSQRNLNRNTGRFLDTQLTLSGNIILQRNAFYQFHNDIIQTVVISYIVYINNVRMRQPGCRLGFFSEFGYECGIFFELCLHNLYCYHTVQFVIFCLVDISHSAAADTADNLISLSYDCSLF